MPKHISADLERGTDQYPEVILSLYRGLHFDVAQNPFSRFQSFLYPSASLCASPCLAVLPLGAWDLSYCIYFIFLILQNSAFAEMIDWTPDTVHVLYAHMLLKCQKVVRCAVKLRSTLIY